MNFIKLVNYIVTLTAVVVTPDYYPFNFCVTPENWYLATFQLNRGRGHKKM
jgi:hypothetical protein